MDKTPLHAMDAGAIAVAWSSFFGWLPTLAALLSIVWTVIRVYETQTFQAFLRWLRSKL